MDYRRPHIHGIVLHLLWPLKVRSDPCILSRRSNLSGYFVTAPNLIRHGSRVSPDYHFNSIASDLRPYLDARHYTLVIGHSLGAAAVLSLFPHLPALYPTAIVLVDPPMQQGPEKLDFLDDMLETVKGRRLARGLTLMLADDYDTTCSIDSAPTTGC